MYFELFSCYISLIKFACFFVGVVAGWVRDATIMILYWLGPFGVLLIKEALCLTYQTEVLYDTNAYDYD